MSKHSDKLKEAIIENLETLVNFYNDKYDFSICDYDCIEVYAHSKKDRADRTCIIRVSVSEENKQIYIPNIFMPIDLKYLGMGKKMIYLIYCLGVNFEYDVFVIDLVDSFREKLIRRGASTCDSYDILHITENTNLLYPVE